MCHTRSSVNGFALPGTAAEFFLLFKFISPFLSSGISTVSPESSGNTTLSFSKIRFDRATPFFCAAFSMSGCQWRTEIKARARRRMPSESFSAAMLPCASALVANNFGGLISRVTAMSALLASCICCAKKSSDSSVFVPSASNTAG